MRVEKEEEAGVDYVWPGRSQEEYGEAVGGF